MTAFLIGKKVGMTRVFEESGKNVPVTLIYVPTNTISQLKSEQNEGYNSVQVAMGSKKRVNKPEKGHLAKAKISSAEVISEFRVDDIKDFKLGEKIGLEAFTSGDEVKVSGITKGKGFQGVIKRHGFRRGPKTHGSDHHRAPGSIGSMFPQHVFKGKKLPGHMGSTNRTTQTKVVSVISEEKLLLIKGAVPGPKGANICVSKA